MKKVLCWALSSTKEVLLPLEGKQSDQPRVLWPAKGRAEVQIPRCLAAKCLPAHRMAGPIYDGLPCWSTGIQAPPAQLRSLERTDARSAVGGLSGKEGTICPGTGEGGDLIFSEHSF